MLAAHFIRKHAAELGASELELAPDALEKLTAHSWPGNVRELENVMERSLVLSTGERLHAADVRIDSAPRAKSSGGDPGFLPDGMTLDQYEESIIREAMKRAQGNKSMAARLLGLTRNALRYRLGQMGMETGGDGPDA